MEGLLLRISLGIVRVIFKMWLKRLSFVDVRLTSNKLTMTILQIGDLRKDLINWWTIKNQNHFTTRSTSQFLTAAR